MPRAYGVIRLGLVSLTAPRQREQSNRTTTAKLPLVVNRISAGPDPEALADLESVTVPAFTLLRARAGVRVGGAGRDGAADVAGALAVGVEAAGGVGAVSSGGDCSA